MFSLFKLLFSFIKVHIFITSAWHLYHQRARQARKYHGFLLLFTLLVLYLTLVTHVYFSITFYSCVNLNACLNEIRLMEPVLCFHILVYSRVRNNPRVDWWNQYVLSYHASIFPRHKPSLDLTRLGVLDIEFRLMDPATLLYSGLLHVYTVL